MLKNSKVGHRLGKYYLKKYLFSAGRIIKILILTRILSHVFSDFPDVKLRISREIHLRWVSILMIYIKSCGLKLFCSLLLPTRYTQKIFSKENNEIVIVKHYIISSTQNPK